MENKQDRICPVCGSRNKHTLYQQKFARIRKVSYIEGYDVTCCDDCGFMFADGIPNQALFNEYYKGCSKYENFSETLTDAFIERYEKSLHFMENCTQSVGKSLKDMEVIDIGCASGNFLRHMKRNGYDKLTGVDPSPQCISFLEHKGIKAQRGSIAEMELNETYDFIMLQSVLEHIENIGEAVWRIKKIMKPGGMVYFSVPNVPELSLTNNAPFQEFSMEHINYFTLKSISNLMAEYGFQLVDTRVTTNEAYSELETVFKQSETPPAIEKDVDGENYLTQYIRHSEKIEAGIHEKLHRLAVSQEPIIIWGIGIHTLHQLAAGPLSDCNITLLVDSNPHYEGADYKGIPVVSPDKISTDNKILISSYHAKDSIISFARNVLHLKNELITLY